ncbi:type I DNA topoisomerase [uncultured Muribaculum sp.]|uniref:type I DNA topoisomerase n=1 Tax=uncultured Muribaculum sp. TaxID=1918613 RepID=UPI0025B040E9|nr:type I DNA topoisomerase [uncultured Muribaculum sp.]
MAKNLVIVESPAKAKTIEKFLGKDYTVLSSYGHIRDLNKKKISIEIERDFSPVYEIPEDKKALVADLRKAAAAAQTVWLASDEDREGEAIAWHLCEVLGLDPATTRRIVFHEITKGAIENAIKNPRTIDLDRVDAQQARRVLDRIVGFELSPVLWKKIKPSLSAGRVQSVAVRLIAERETEIKAFNAEPYFRVTADFVTTGIKAHLTGVLSERLTDINAVSKFLSDCTNATYSVSSVQRKPLTRQPAPPFTTSTLQQEASRKLGMTVAQTMAVAQRLYESGHITYMRTDSLNLSETAIAAISKEITASIGAEYLKPRQYHTASKGAQEAHEAIRPTNIAIRDISASAQEKRLYNLIWKRTVASQMSDAQIEKTTIEILPSTRPEHFAATAEAIKFDGFLRLYTEGRDEPDEPGQPVTLPPLKKGDKLKAATVTATERFTQQPPRYTEASLVKKMEELGIGRPSTYAPTISTIQAREYIEKGQNDGQPRNYRVVTLANGEISHSENTEISGGDKGRLIPTDIGIIVNNFLMEYFPAILDYDFTARMEEKFDLIAEGKLPWSGEIATFYKLFHPDVENAMSMRLEHKVGERILGSHPQTGKTVSVKIGRFGPLVQIGDADSDEKPQFASLLKNQSVSTITLDEALKLFEFPRSLGTYEGSDVTVAIGRFGPYVKHAGKFISIPKDIAPAEITIEQAEELIKAKRDAENKKVVKIFTEDPDLQILNGRYGIYIAYKKNNYKIPRTVENPAELTLEQCREIISQQDSKPQKTTRSRSSARK